ncbi:MAG: uroporphyrinogen decarboxylase family protein [Phycisphaerae bacterium]|jgi:uroporphyrinogen decarboxylase
MNSRERILAAIEHREVDRVPTDIWAVGEVWQKLHERFGSNQAAYSALHIDGIHGVGPRYTGPALPSGDNYGIAYYSGIWGTRTRPIQYATGLYYEQCFYPLADATSIDDLERFNWPKAEWFDYSQLAAQAAELHKTQVVSCGYMAPFTYHLYLRGLEQMLMDPLLDPDFTRHFLGRLSDFMYDHHRRIFEAADGLIDITQVTDDYGMQTGPMISLETFREFYKPHVARFAALAHEFGVKVFHHDDGAMRDFIPDLLEVGIDVLNPIQWRCPGMEIEGLKRDFGSRLCFHGGVDNQQTLPFGTPDDVRAEVRHLIDVLAGDRTGFILAPCHNIQACTPIENILAMYDEAHKYGKF